MALGLDTNTRNPDWAKLKANGLDFAYLKVSEGGDFPSEAGGQTVTEVNWYARQTILARAAGVKVGGYHFARPDTSASTAREEAEFFLSRLKLERGDLKPVLDFEHDPPNADWALKWLEIVKEKIGAKPIFYSYGPFIARMSRQAELQDYPLWLADYGVNDGTRHQPHVPDGFRLVAHQYTSKGRLPGISGDVDLNHAPTLAPLIYDPIYEGEVEFLVNDQVVATGNFTTDGHPTLALTKWAREVRRNRGHGAVRPKA